MEDEEELPVTETAFGEQRPSERRVAREVARLLRSGCDDQRLGANETGRRLLALCGTSAEALKWLDRAIASLRPLSPSGVRAQKLMRQFSILARYDRTRESRTAIARDLGISPRQFYKERSRALVRLATLIAESDLQNRMRIATRQPLDAALAEADAYDDAGEPERAVSALRALLSTVNAPLGRLEILIRMIAPLARVGRTAEANHVAAAARRSLGAVDVVARTGVEGRLLLAELCRTQHQDDRAGYTRTFVDICRRIRPAVLSGDQSATRTLTAAFLDHAMNRVDVGDSRGAEESLREAEALAARMLELPAAMQIQASIVTVGVHVDQPEHFAQALREAVEAYRAAHERGLLRLARQALYQCTSAALIARKADCAARCGQVLLKQGRLSGDRDCLTRANFALAGADYLFGRYDRALERLNAMQTPATAGSVGDMVVDLLRARVLCGIGRLDVAHNILQNVIVQASAASMEQAVAMALLLKSRIAARLRDVRGARNDLGLGLELLSRYPTPFQLVRAYQHAFQLTRRKRYRDDLGDLWRLIAPAFMGKDDFVDVVADEDVSRSPEPVDDIASVLTQRQQTIADLVRIGKTNREIATRLGLSIRTVDQHVRSILQRLSIERRWEIDVPASASVR